MRNKPIEITEENIKCMHLQTMEEYGSDFKLIKTILKNSPDNVELSCIELKILVIDVLNSTNLTMHKNIITRSDIAKIIQNITDFDKRIFKGDPSLVSAFANEIKRKGVNLFSFATKYCAFHNWYAHEKDDYSIYDSMIHKILPRCSCTSPITKTEIEKWKANCDYEKFNNYIGELLDQNNIHMEKRRYKFDHFLWYIGKENKKLL